MPYALRFQICHQDTSRSLQHVPRLVYPVAGPINGSIKLRNTPIIRHEWLYIPQRVVQEVMLVAPKGQDVNVMYLRLPVAAWALWNQISSDRCRSTSSSESKETLRHLNSPTILARQAARCQHDDDQHLMPRAEVLQPQVLPCSASQVRAPSQGLVHLDQPPGCWQRARQHLLSFWDRFSICQFLYAGQDDIQDLGYIRPASADDGDARIYLSDKFISKIRTVEKNFLLFHTTQTTLRFVAQWSLATPDGNIFRTTAI